MDLSNIDDSKYEIQTDFICKQCHRNELIISNQNIWKLGMQLYYTLVEPLENYVIEKKGNRLNANLEISECSTFPKKDFDVSLNPLEIIDAKEIQINGYHSGSLQFNNGLTYLYFCERPKLNMFKYQGITMSHSNTIVDAMPKGWLDLPGSEELKIDSYKDYDNWLFYERDIPLEKDRTTYQVIGWNQTSFSLFFTFEKDKSQST